MYLRYIKHIYIYIRISIRYIVYINRSLEVKLPTIWTDEKQSREEAERRERSEGKKMEMREKVGKSRNTCVFPMICGSGGSQSRLAKAAGAEPAGQISDEKLHAIVVRSRFPSQNVQKHTSVGPLLEVEMSKKCTPLWREAHLQVKMYKTHHCRTHFWKLRCRKSARRCGAKHISKSKCTKHTIVGPLLEVAMSKKCTPLWREGHFEVKMFKTPGVRTTFGGSDVASLQYTTLQDITLHYTPVHYIALHYTPVHSTTLNYTTPHYITLNDTATRIDR